MELIDRINKNLPDILDKNHCLIWSGAKDKKGYGIISHNKKTFKVHRLMYEIYYSKSLKELHCLHTCDNPSCVNPLHLFAGTNLDNVKDKINKKRCYTGYQKGESNGASKLKDIDVIEIRKLYNTGEYNTIKLGEIYKVHRSTISHIVNDKTYKHLLKIN
jgi:hypothetical protein